MLGYKLGIVLKLGVTLGTTDGSDEELGTMVGTDEGPTLTLGVVLGISDGRTLTLGNVVGTNVGSGLTLGIELGNGVNGTAGAAKAGASTGGFPRQRPTEVIAPSPNSSTVIFRIFSAPKSTTWTELSPKPVTFRCTTTPSLPVRLIVTNSSRCMSISPM